MISDAPTPPVIGIVGWKSSGKTTLAVRLIEELVRRGWRVATVKHAHHDIEIDAADTDSARHRHAGATEVAVVSRHRWAIVHELADEFEPDLAEVLSWLSPADLVIVEGYKSAPIPKIEVRRRDAQSTDPLGPADPHVIAIVADYEVTGNGLPVFALDDTRSLVDFIADRVIRAPGS
jgi:molybdopterin-guanine dinucleotide biosynthesis protein B